MNFMFYSCLLGLLKARTKDYAVIVRGYRDKDGKVKQKTVQNLGPVNDKNREQMLAMGRKDYCSKERGGIYF